jgi:hypothetical protein
MLCGPCTDFTLLRLHHQTPSSFWLKFFANTHIVRSSVRLCSDRVQIGLLLGGGEGKQVDVRAITWMARHVAIRIVIFVIVPGLRYKCRAWMGWSPDDSLCGRTLQMQWREIMC